MLHMQQFPTCLHAAESSTAQGVGPVANMSEKDMKLLLKKMERQVVALKGELKDYEWRLDQESAVGGDNQTRNAIMCALTQDSAWSSTCVTI